MLEIVLVGTITAATKIQEKGWKYVMNYLKKSCVASEIRIITSTRSFYENFLAKQTKKECSKIQWEIAGACFSRVS